MGLRAVWGLTSEAHAPAIYTKDFIQEYTLARAVLGGHDPYASRSELTTSNGMPDVGSHWIVTSAPTPHPPPVALFFLPFGLLSFETAVPVWLAAEIVCLILTTLVLLRTAGRRASLWLVLVVAFNLTLSRPFRVELNEGQLMVLMLLVLALARMALLEQRPILSGILLGLTLSLKLLMWPVLVLLALRRNWTMCLAAIGTSVLTYTLAAVVLGPGVIVDYMVRVLPASNAAYRYASNTGNLSVWTVGARLFEGVTSPNGGPGTGAEPLAYAPLLGDALSIALPCAVLVVGTFFAYQQANLDQAIGIMLCVSLLISPVAWIHYFVLALLPIAQFLTWFGWRSLVKSWPGGVVLACALLLSISGIWQPLARVLAGTASNGGPAQTDLPFGPALLTLVPTLAVCALGWALAAARTTTLARAPRLTPAAASGRSGQSPRAAPIPVAWPDRERVGG